MCKNLRTKLQEKKKIQVKYKNDKQRFSKRYISVEYVDLKCKYK